ncbi:Vacuolar protein sorting-associated protein 41 [Lecanora helva]
MAPEVEDEEPEDGAEEDEHLAIRNGTAAEDQPDEEDEVSEEEEDEEPLLKYASLTKHLKSVYRNGDATSTFMVAGGKMILGTHNGNIHVLSVPSLNPIHVYHAHTASTTGLSLSPFPPPLGLTKLDAVNKNVSERTDSPRPSKSKQSNASPSSRTPKQRVPLTPSNMIYIGSASLDGNVCIQSLTDPKDVQLRNFGRPVQAVALSPDYRSDRSYLSGGLAGNLVLTVGGRTGTTSKSSTAGGTAAATSGWLGSIGLSANAGKDQILHSGEGAISTIKWSLSGKFIVWVNEKGIKIMRSNLHLDSGDTELGWKRISHIDHPNRPGWEEMAGIWKAHVEWIDEAGLESDEGFPTANGSVNKASDPPDVERFKSPQKSRQIEKLIVGWSGTIWIFNIHPESSNAGTLSNEGRKPHVDIVTMYDLKSILRIDCIISGIALYTPNLLLVLAYITPEENDTSNAKTTKRGRHRRQNALQPEMRIINITTKEEVSVADTLNMSRFESLSATDYHLGVLPAMRISTKTTNQKGYVEAIGGHFEAIGGGIWDATMYPTRLFSSAASVTSIGSPGSSLKGSNDAVTANNIATPKTAELPHPATLTHGMKIFIHSPYDCVIATKPSLSDHLAWLDHHHKYEEAWKLLDRYPEAAYSQSDKASDSISSTPTKAQGSLIDFLNDDISQTTSSGQRGPHFQAEKEKGRIGEQWVQQLIATNEWAKAGQTCGLVLGTSSTWEHWVWVFAEANKYEEITPYIPTTQLHPPLPSLVYELILGHYVSTDRPRLQELLELWPSDLFDSSTIVEAIESKLKTGEVREDSTEGDVTGRDWRILTSALAKLYLTNGQARKALSCYIRLQDADAAMQLISEYHLVSAVADDIPGFILLRVTKTQQQSAPLQELEAQTLEPICLLVSEAHQGIVPPETVISQLTKRYGIPNPYLYFYFRALWTGEAASSTTTTTTPSVPPKAPSRNHPSSQPTSSDLLASEALTLLSPHADTAITLFAAYSRPLLLPFLKTSTSYTLSHASSLCRLHHFTPELVYLLSKEGRTTSALRLIIDSIGDVRMAIEFCKEQNDTSLWDDLLDYSMSKPSFIRGLLQEIGTSIDPLKLVQRIPLGLEIEGLKEGLGRMLREYEVQESISLGVARVLRGEVNERMLERGRGQRKGVRFDIAPLEKKAVVEKERKRHHPPKVVRAGFCAGCDDAINEHGRDFLVGFPCAHVFHLPCLLRYEDEDRELPEVLASFSPFDEGGDGGYDRSIGPKVDHAALLRTVVGSGCPVAMHHVDEQG